MWIIVDTMGAYIYNIVKYHYIQLEIYIYIHAIINLIYIYINESEVKSEEAKNGN